jgi:hypothetical protein
VLDNLSFFCSFYVFRRVVRRTLNRRGQELIASSLLRARAMCVLVPMDIAEPKVPFSCKTGREYGGGYLHVRVAKVSGADVVRSRREPKILVLFSADLGGGGILAVAK